MTRTIKSCLIATVLTLGAAMNARAATRTWPAGNVGGSEANPWDIHNSSNWGGNTPSSSDHLNFSVSELTYLTNSATINTKIADCLQPISGDFVFLGDIYCHVFGDMNSGTTGTKVSVVKKGDWKMKYSMWLARYENTVMAFTNETGSITVSGGEQQWMNVRIGDGNNSKTTIRNVSGNWTINNTTDMILGGGSGSSVSITSSNGNWTVTGTEMIIGKGSDSSVIIEKDGGDWTINKAIRLAQGSGSTAEFRHRGGSLTLTGGYGIQMGWDSTRCQSLFEISGGAVTNNVWGIGIADAGQTGSESKFVVKGDGEYYSTKNINLGHKSTGYLNIEDQGRVTADHVTFCGDSGCGSGEDCYLNLSGGTLATKYIDYGSGSANATMTFNGGTLKATAAGTLISAHNNLSVKVGSGGGTIDTSGYDVTIAEDLDNASGASGVLCFTGGGVATLTGTVACKISVTPGTTIHVATKTLADAILANGIDLVGSTVAGDWTVLTCDEALSGADLANVTCGIANGCTPYVDGNSIKVSLNATLVAKWDFNNYDPSNPTSDAVLQATVGGNGKACYYSGGGSALVGDGTIGSMSVVDTGLGEGNYAIRIPASSHIALPIPDAVKNHYWTMKIRFRYPTAGVWHSFFNRRNTTDGDLFLNTSNKIGGGQFALNNNYNVAVSSGTWHTITISAGKNRTEVFLDEGTEALQSDAIRTSYFSDPSEALTVYGGVGHLLLCADESGEDSEMLIDYVELYDDAGAMEGKASQYTKASLTGEWTFPQGDCLKATVGRDLVKHTRTGSASFTEGTDGVLPGDGYVRAGHNNDFKCYHGLPANSAYTVVMDVRVPDNGNKTQEWHSLFMTKADSNDGNVFIWWKDGKYRIKFNGSNNYPELGCGAGEWVRVAFSYNGSGRTLYVNGVQKNVGGDSKWADMAPVKGGYFLLLGDNDGEDWDVDISYAAVYDRALSAAQIAELHSRPLAQRPDGSFVPTVAPAAVWEADGIGGLAPAKGTALSPSGNGGYTWTRAEAPADATYVFDLTRPNPQSAAGVLAMNAGGVASGIFASNTTYDGCFSTETSAAAFLGNSALGTWGYCSLMPLASSVPHRVTVVRTGAGRVHFYVDGRLYGRYFPTRTDASAAPSATMTFLDGLASGATRIAAYDAALTPDEVASLGTAGYAPTGNAPNAPTISAAVAEPPAKAMVDTVTFTVSATHPDGEYVTFAIDYGDGTGDGMTRFVPSGTSATFTHTYNQVGTMTPRVKAFSQNGVESAWTTATPITIVAPQIAARDMLLTWPWQQNVYTNRFTIMCEGVKDAGNPSRWDGLEVQYGENYAQSAAMTRVEGNGGTWIYKAQITVDGAEGQTIPYRLGYFGAPLTYENAADNTEGAVRLWTNADAPFTCSIWGDNQQGAKAGDWDSNRYLYLTNMFRHMLARNVDFGLSTGDMSSNGNYGSETRPCILDTTDAIFGRVKPYYISWGNHDNVANYSKGKNKPYFETGAINDPDYLDSDTGNYYLYRGNVLFIFIDYEIMTVAKTRTWLADVLATDRARNAKFRILLQHAPFWLECWGGNNNQSLLETAKAGGVDIVFSGHMHGYERIHKEGIVQLTNGGAGYLDHTESVNANYGDDTFMGGHKDVPYLWARQKSSSETDVLGAANPVHMGCITSYGELKVDGGVLTYTAHGFNADGSYIGVFDEFSVTSKTVAASAPAAPQQTYCADPSAYAEFTAKPVSNAAWKQYKDAVGEAFSYADGAGSEPVVNVSKDEIGKFLVWLNGQTGTYRLPTLSELETAFGNTLRRSVAEWSSSIDPETGWCRILGSPAVAADGVWTGVLDSPSIGTGGCHANYLGFRLATGTAVDDMGVWTGSKDNNLDDPDNWSSGSVPNGTCAYFSVDAAASLTHAYGGDFSPSRIVFLADSAPVTISGEGTIASVVSIVNHSSVSHVINIPVAFDDEILVVQPAMSWEQRTNPSIRFAGGVSGTTFAEGTARYLDGLFTLSTGEGWVANTQGSNNRWGVPAESFLTLPSATDTSELIIGEDSARGGAFTTGVVRTSTRLLCYNYGEYVVTNELEFTQPDSVQYCGWDNISKGTFKFEKMTLKGEYDRPFKFGTQNESPADSGDQYFYIGQGGLCFGSGANAGLRYETGGGRNNMTVHLNPWHGDYTIHKKDNADDNHDFYLSTVTYFGTTDENGEACTVTADAIFNSGSNGAMHIDGSGKFVVNAVNKCSCPVTVHGSNGATLVINAGKKVTTGAIAVNNGATLEVAESGTVTLGGNLTLASGAKLKFNFTDKQNAPQLAVSGTATVPSTLDIEITGLQPTRGEYNLTTGEKFADATTVNFVNKPEWAIASVEDGNIKLKVFSGLVLSIK